MLAQDNWCFILGGEDGRTVISVDDKTFHEWIATKDFKYPTVADAEVVPGVRVMTQFIGTDPHGDPANPKPFITFVIGGKFDGYTVRTNSWGDAHNCHFWVFDYIRRYLRDGNFNLLEFVDDITAEGLMRWGFTPTDAGNEYEREVTKGDSGVQNADELEGVNLIVRVPDGAVSLGEYVGSEFTNVVDLPPLKTLGQVVRLVNAIKGL